MITYTINLFGYALSTHDQNIKQLVYNIHLLATASFLVCKVWKINEKDISLGGIQKHSW